MSLQRVSYWPPGRPPGWSGLLSSPSADGQAGCRLRLWLAEVLAAGELIIIIIDIISIIAIVVIIMPGRPNWLAGPGGPAGSRDVGNRCQTRRDWRRP